jgi:hypothetical protein
MQARRVRVQIDTLRLRVTGTLQLPTEGYRSRATDFLNGHETGFIPLVDVTLEPTDGGPAEEQAYVAVGARHIVAMAELEDLGVDEERTPPGYGTGISVPPPS